MGGRWELQPGSFPGMGSSRYSCVPGLLILEDIAAANGAHGSASDTKRRIVERQPGGPVEFVLQPRFDIIVDDTNLSPAVEAVCQALSSTGI